MKTVENKNTHSVMLAMIRYFGSDAKRINHAIKVHGFATNIAALEQLSEKEQHIVSLAAILHDIGIHEAEKKYNSNGGNYQEIEGPPLARMILTKHKFADDVIDRVCFIISKHHTYSEIDGKDFQILIEADFIVNAFEDGLSKHAVETCMKKHFKTDAGKVILDSMYLQ